MFHGQKARPEKLTLEYFRSKDAEEHRKIAREFELLQNPSVSLERAKRRLIHADEVLVDRKASVKEERISLEAQWKTLEEKEFELQQNFLFFDKFVKENHGKRVRAKEKMNKAKEFYEDAKRKVEAVEKKFERHSQSRKIMEQLVRKHKIYENFLDQVIGPDYGFKSIDDIIDRYDSFLEAKHQLMLKQEVAIKDLQNAHCALAKMIENYKLVMVGLHTKVASYRGRYDEALIKSRKWETIVKTIKKATQEQFSHVQMVRWSVWDTYKDCCLRKDLPVLLKGHQIEEQLLYIKKAMLIIKRVCIRAKKTLHAKEKHNK